jgi:hypothetical protein
MRRTAAGWRPVLRVWGLPRSLPALAAYFMLRELSGIDSALTSLALEYIQVRKQHDAVTTIISLADEAVTSH